MSLNDIAKWAGKIQKNRHLQSIVKGSARGLVHFRPSATGIAMVGLLPDRPLRGKSDIDIEKDLDDFDNEFKEHCVDIEQGRINGRATLMVRVFESDLGSLEVNASHIILNKYISLSIKKDVYSSYALS